MGVWSTASASPVLDASLSILADGKARSADEILAEAQRRELLGSAETPKLVQNALSQFIQRALARGRKPIVLKEPGGRFRLNRPLDDWPPIDTTGLPALTPSAAPAPEAAATLAALERAAAGTDPTAFEAAVCKTFELFGFSGTHLGGHGAPDGHADALLGVLRYRVMLECKLGRGDTISNSNAPAEAAKFRESYGADYCALVAPAFDGVVTFSSELQAHGVAAWTIADLVDAAKLRLDCSEMLALFAPGFAVDALDDLAWEKIHGRPRRLRVVASLLVEIGLQQQRSIRVLSDRESTPRLTKDVALSLLDERLAAAGSARGAALDDIDAAFAWLTSPFVGRAIWADDARDAIVIAPSRS
ncbi:MAG TPA: hypothetical protein VIW73_12320 [Candidatus Cybelea sp.]